MANDWQHFLGTFIMTGRQMVGFPQYYDSHHFNLWGPLINGVATFNCSLEYPQPDTDRFHSYCKNPDEMQLPVFTLESGKRYRFRFINTGVRNPLNFTIDNHKMLMVNAQGTDLEPKLLDAFSLMVAQRLDVIVVANQSVDNYWLRVTVDKAYRYAENAGEGRHYGRQSKAIIRYVGAPEEDPSSAQIENPITHGRYDWYYPAPDVPKPPATADLLFYGNISFGNAECGGFPMGFPINPIDNPPCIGPTFTINGIPSAVGAGVPLLYQVASGNKNPQMLSGSVCNVPYGKVTDVILQSTQLSGLDHSMHIHGYKFWLIGEGEGLYDPATEVLNLENPPYIDTVHFTSSRYAHLRFIGNNPGMWMLHCHMDGHNFDGVMLVFNVAPERINSLASQPNSWHPTIFENHNSDSNSGNSDSDDDSSDSNNNSGNSNNNSGNSNSHGNGNGYGKGNGNWNNSNDDDDDK